MSQPNGAEVLIDILNGYGVEAIFSSPGSEWPPLWEALARRQASVQPTSGPAPRCSPRSMPNCAR